MYSSTTCTNYIAKEANLEKALISVTGETENLPQY
jgi:hypothetical protein